jgi:hypothetical protein
MNISPDNLEKAVEAAIIASANHRGKPFKLPLLDNIALIKKPISQKAYEELYVEHEVAFKAALKTVASDAWQPIEDAPENVNLVLKYKTYEAQLLNIAAVDPNDSTNEAHAMVLAASKIAVIIINSEFGGKSVDELIDGFIANLNIFREVAREIREVK